MNLELVYTEQGARSRVAEVSLARGDGAPRRARQHLTEELGRTDAPALHDVLLLVNELVTNSVLHGGGHDVRVRAVAGDDCIRVEVSDVGPGFTVDGPQRLPAKAQATGRGLVIVERLATRWGVERRGGVTCVWFEIDR